MRSSDSRIPDFIRRTLVVALAVALVASAPATANESTPQQRALAEMNGGKDYSAAWAAESRTSGQGYSETLVARARKAARALNEGTDYQAAWEASSLSTDVGSSLYQLARAKRLEEELRNGKDYVAAREAGGATQRPPGPARVKTVEAAGRDGVGSTE